MTIWNLGSINADFVYRVPHLPTAGETLHATTFDRFLGGKGANMSVASARAGAHVMHIGAVGADGAWAVERLLEYGVDTRLIETVSEPTGHAVICVSDDGENQIVLMSGANNAVSETGIKRALASANAGDIFVTQNETSCQVVAAGLAKDLGLLVVYAAAPFDIDAVQAVRGHVDLLILNEVEAAQFEAKVGAHPSEVGIDRVIVTLGANGSELYQGGSQQKFDAVPAKAVDTTGAGDTFTGYVLSGLDRGMPIEQAVGQASVAAALMVARHGTADVIPDLKEVQDAMQA